MVACPRYVEVNGDLQPPTYEIKENDRIETRPYYTVGQLAEFMDVHPDPDTIAVNNREADFETLIYENFEIEWEVLPEYAQYDDEPEETAEPVAETKEEEEAEEPAVRPAIEVHEGTIEDQKKAETEAEAEEKEEASAPKVQELPPKPQDLTLPITVKVNGEEFRLDQKQDYVFVDIFDVIDFDLSDSRGRAIVTQVNGKSAQYSQKLHDGDEIAIYWKET